MYIKNILSLESGWTLVTQRNEVQGTVIKSVTYNHDISLLRVYGGGLGYKPGVIVEIGQALTTCGINTFSVIASQTCINLLLGTDDLKRSIDVLQPIVGGVVERLEAKDNVALITVVGEGLVTTKGLAAKVFSAVAMEDINVEMISSGASDVAAYCIIQRNRMERVIRAVHRTFFE